MQHAFTKKQNVALLILRFVIAVIFFQAAYVKLGLWSATPEGMTEGMANFMKFISVAEFLGGLGLVFGILTRWAAGGLAVIMLGAIYTLQFTLGVGFTTPTGPGWNFPLVILVACFIIIDFGAGSFSLDAKKDKKSLETSHEDSNMQSA